MNIYLILYDARIVSKIFMTFIIHFMEDFLFLYRILYIAKKSLMR